MILPQLPATTPKMDAIISIQSQIRDAICSDDDSAAMALDALLANRRDLQSLAVYLAYWVFRPYEVKL